MLERVWCWVLSVCMPSRVHYAPEEGFTLFCLSLICDFRFCCLSALCSRFMETLRWQEKPWFGCSLSYLPLSISRFLFIGTHNWVSITIQSKERVYTPIQPQLHSPAHTYLASHSFIPINSLLERMYKINSIPIGGTFRMVLKTNRLVLLNTSRSFNSDGDRPTHTSPFLMRGL